MRRTPLEPQNEWKPSTSVYVAAHQYVRTIRGTPEVCRNCGTTKDVEWANLTGAYHDVEDFIELCKSCHRRADQSLTYPCGHLRVEGKSRCNYCRKLYKRMLYFKQKENPEWWTHKQQLNQAAGKRRTLRKQGGAL